MSAAPALSACPFCGGPANYFADRDDDGRFIAVQCSGCGCGSGKHYPLKDDARPNAAQQWNRRYTPPGTALLPLIAPWSAVVAAGNIPVSNRGHDHLGRDRPGRRIGDLAAKNAYESIAHTINGSHPPPLPTLAIIAAALRAARKIIADDIAELEASHSRGATGRREDMDATDLAMLEPYDEAIQRINDVLGELEGRY